MADDQQLLKRKLVEEAVEARRKYMAAREPGAVQALGDASIHACHQAIPAAASLIEELTYSLGKAEVARDISMATAERRGGYMKELKEMIADLEYQVQQRREFAIVLAKELPACEKCDGVAWSVSSGRRWCGDCGEVFEYDD